MRATLSSLTTLLAGMALIMIGVGLQGTLLGVRGILAGFDAGTLGFVMATYYIGYFFGSILAPLLIARVGHIRVFAAMASIASLAPLIHAVAVVPWVWSLMRLLTGVATASIFVIAESWLNERCDNDNRGRVMALYTILCMAGMAAGQFLLTVADPAGLIPFILVSVLLSSAVVPIALSSRPAPHFGISDSSISLRAFYHSAPFAVGGIFLVSIAYGSFYGMGAVFAMQAGLQPSQISLVMAGGIAGCLIGQWPLGVLSDHYDRRKIIIGSSVLAAVTCVGLLKFHNGSPAMYALMFLFGALSLTLYSILVAHAQDCLDGEQRVGASSLIVRLSGAGSILGPLAVSGLNLLAGNSAFPLVLIVVHLMVALFGLSLLASRPKLGAEQQTHHMVSQRASPVAVSVSAILDEELEPEEECDRQGAPVEDLLSAKN